jgi:type IV pilus assembly protein PilW
MMQEIAIDPRAMRSRVTGLTLIELMVALAIGAFLMIGAVTVFMQSRTSFRITESVSRLQENARFVLDAVEPDVRMSHYWGLTNLTYMVQGRRKASEPAGAGPVTCGNNWAIDLESQVGANNGYNWACAPTGGSQPNSDTLIVRRASEDSIAPGDLVANTLYVQSARGAVNSQIFQGTVLPAEPSPAVSRTHRLIANGYYVSQTSSLGAALPSLRVKTLLNGGLIQDQEVMPGVEDMQVQYGVDTDAEGVPTRGSIDRYVNAGDPIITPGAAGFIPSAEILAVRVWFRLRAERAENGFVDNTTYVYADQNVGPFNDAFRRVVIAKTIYLRNARPAS